MPLPYMWQIIEEACASNGLHIIARGLGLQQILARILRAFCVPGQLVFLLNVSEDEELYLLNQLRQDGVTLLPHFMRSDFSIQERTDFYLQGGCLCVNPRNLVVDFLHRRVPTHLISGFFVNQAHRVDEDSPEAFILRLFRDSSASVFIKAFSQHPEYLAEGQQLQKVLKALQVQSVHFWPRFRLEVIQSLESVKPDVVEILPTMPDRMAEVQNHINDIMVQVLSELTSKASVLISSTHFTLENALTGDLFRTLRDELGPSFHTLPASTKRLVEDLKSLRDLLLLLYSTDCVTFYHYLDNLVTSSRTYMGIPGIDPVPAEWTLTAAGSRLLSVARDRVFCVNRKRKAEEGQAKRAGEAFHERLTLTLEPDPKWEALSDILREVEADGGGEETEAGKVLILVHSDRTRAQLSQFLCMGSRALLQRLSRRYLLQAYPAGCSTESTSDVERVLRAEAANIRRAGNADRVPDAISDARASGLAASSDGGQSRASAPKRLKHSGMSLGDKAALAQDAAAGAWTSASLMHPAAHRMQQAARRQRPKLPRAAQQRPDPEVAEKKTAQPKLEVPDQMEPEVFDILPDPAIEIHTYEGALGLLEMVHPKFVVMYDADVAFIRQVEMYVNENPERPLRVYMLLHDQSMEKQRFLSLLGRERRAFQHLVKLKADLLPVPHAVFGTLDQREVELQTLELTEVATSRRGGASLKNLQPSRKGIVVVDMREFRSALPSQLHARGLSVLPVTLEVGDYVLTPTLCVERKSVQDLYQSFNSGRLFHQIEAMSRHYSQPTLLIEFTKRLPFSLLGHPGHSSLQGLLGITERLALLAIHCPTLRLLWCRTPQVTATMFEQLKEGQPDPDTSLAAQVATDADPSVADAGSDSVTAEEMLIRLPGVTPSNVVYLTSAFPNLRGVFRASHAKLAQLLGPTDGPVLFNFLHRTHWGDVKEPRSTTSDGRCLRPGDRSSVGDVLAP